MVAIERPEFVPDASLDRAAMEELQRTIGREARFENDLGFDPAALAERRPFVDGDGGGGTVQRSVIDDWTDDGSADPDRAGTDGVGTDSAGTDSAGTDSVGTEIAETDSAETDSAGEERPAAAAADVPETLEQPVIAGVDQAFREDEAVSAVVATRDGEVIERVHATAPLEIPYIPGLLSFREGGSILAALDELSVEPDLLLVDGSGRIHFREAGLATHVGLTVGVPAVGVAKSLLCGTPAGDTDGLAVGDVVPIEADDGVTAPDGTVIGAAVQTRQYDSPDRYVNPLYVSPGHRVGWETAADLALATTAGYKLPEPIRRADRWVGELAAE